MSEQIILNISGVNKRFGGLQALSNVAVSIKKGQTGHRHIRAGRQAVLAVGSP
jgi:ABC-type uncharacterized transport system ATPase subunit